MFTLRCTQKLLRRVSSQSPGEEQPPTTLLGDWYVNILFSRPQHLVLCISERTLLPVVVSVKDAKTLPLRVANAIHAMLLTLQVEPTAAQAERNEMHIVRVGRTANKRILGTLNEFMFHLEDDLHAHPERSLGERAVRLAEIPCKPIEYNSPDRATKALFLSASALKRASKKSAL